MKKLKKLREKKNYSYKNIADHLNISKVFYWQLENKKRKLSYEMALKIAEIFNKKPDYIFYEEYEETE